MAEANPTTTTTTNQATTDVTKQIADLTSLVSGLTDVVGKLVKSSSDAASAPKPAPTTGGNEPLTAKGVADIVAKVIGETKAAEQKAASVVAAIEKVAKERLAGVPAAYHKLLPSTDDAAALEKAATEIRTQYQADLKTAGATVPNVTGNPAVAQGGAGTNPGAAIDFSKIPTDQLFQMGLKDMKPSASATGVAGVANVAGAAAVAATAAAK